MTLALFGAVVAAGFLLSWLLEFSRKEESLPSLGNRRHVAPVVCAILLTLVAIPIALWPLMSVAEWPRATQIAWTAVESVDRNSGAILLGGRSIPPSSAGRTGASGRSCRSSGRGRGVSG